MAKINGNFNFNIRGPISILIGGGIFLIIIGIIISELLVGIGLLFCLIGVLLYMDNKKK